MAEPKEAIYEVGSTIEFSYRCNGDGASANPAAEVIDELRVVDVGQTLTFTQVGTSRLFTSSFIPDVVGLWSVHITDSNDGDVVKDFQVGDIGAQTTADTVVVIDGKADGIKAKTDNLPTDPASNTNVDAVGTAVADVDSDVVAVAGQVSTVDGKADDIKAVTDALPAAVADDATVAKAADVALDATVSKEATAAKEATVSKEATAAKDATVAKDSTVAKDATVAKKSDLDAVQGGAETLESIKGAVDAIEDSDSGGAHFG